LSTRLVRLLTITAILCLACGSVRAARASRIELVDSTVFNDVEYTVDNTYKVITITGEGSDRTVSFTQIRLILDASGQDVTEDCLGSYYRPAGQPSSTKDLTTTVPQAGMTPVPASAAPTEVRPRHPFKAGFRLGSNYSFPMGGWYEGTRSGIGFEGDFLVTVGRRTALRASISKSGARHDIDELLGGWMVLQDDLSWKVWRYFLSVQYYNWPRWRKNGRMMYFLYSGIGAVSHQLTGTAVGYDPPSDLGYYLEGNGETFTKFATNFGGGLTAMVTQTLGFEFAAEMDMVFVGSTNTTEHDYYGAPADVVTALFFDLKFGVVLLFRPVGERGTAGSGMRQLQGNNTAGEATRYCCRMANRRDSRCTATGHGSRGQARVW
jgi:hypothetical protein